MNHIILNSLLSPLYRICHPGRIAQTRVYPQSHYFVFGYYGFRHLGCPVAVAPAIPCICYYVLQTRPTRPPQLSPRSSATLRKVDASACVLDQVHRHERAWSLENKVTLNSRHSWHPTRAPSRTKLRRPVALPQPLRLRLSLQRSRQGYSSGSARIRRRRRSLSSRSIFTRSARPPNRRAWPSAAGHSLRRPRRSPVPPPSRTSDAVAKPSRHHPARRPTAITRVTESSPRFWQQEPKR